MKATRLVFRLPPIVCGREYHAAGPAAAACCARIQAPRGDADGARLQSLYDAIEQRDVRFRMALGRALERLIILVLDHILTHREFQWLGAEHDKVAHFLTTTSLDRDALRRLAFRVAELLGALPAWSVHLPVVVRQPDTEGCAQRLAEVYEDAFHHEFGTPLDPVTANELRWFWEATTIASGPLDERRMRRARRIFGTPRFRALRRALELDGPRAVDVTSSRGIADMLHGD